MNDEDLKEDGAVADVDQSPQADTDRERLRANVHVILGTILSDPEMSNQLAEFLAIGDMSDRLSAVESALTELRGTVDAILENETTLAIGLDAALGNSGPMEYTLDANNVQVPTRWDGYKPKSVLEEMKGTPEPKPPRPTAVKADLVQAGTTSKTVTLPSRRLERGSAVLNSMRQSAGGQ